jgi:hypothetical protein
VPHGVDDSSPGLRSGARLADVSPRGTGCCHFISEKASPKVRFRVRDPSKLWKQRRDESHPSTCWVVVDWYLGV